MGIKFLLTNTDKNADITGLRTTYKLDYKKCHKTKTLANIDISTFVSVFI